MKKEELFRFVALDLVIKGATPSSRGSMFYLEEEGNGKAVIRAISKVEAILRVLSQENLFFYSQFQGDKAVYFLRDEQTGAEQVLAELSIPEWHLAGFRHSPETFERMYLKRYSLLFSLLEDRFFATNGYGYPGDILYSSKHLEGFLHLSTAVSRIINFCRFWKGGQGLEFRFEHPAIEVVYRKEAQARREVEGEGEGWSVETPFFDGEKWCDDNKPFSLDMETKKILGIPIYESMSDSVKVQRDGKTYFSFEQNSGCTNAEKTSYHAKQQQSSQGCP